MRIRINSLVNIANYASCIDSNVLYLEQSMYLNLKKMREGANGKGPKPVLPKETSENNSSAANSK